MKSFVLFFSILLLALSCRNGKVESRAYGETSSSQDCSQLPAYFDSYSQAIEKVASSKFKIKETADFSGSSWLRSATFFSCDGESGYMIYTTNKGRDYIHANLPTTIWTEFKQAPSKGSYYNKNIKGRYQLSL